MGKTELIQHLYDEISRQNTWYMWTVGLFVTIIGILVAIFGYLQVRLSDKQISNMKRQFRNEFHVDEMDAQIKNMSETNNKYNKILSELTDIVDNQMKSNDKEFKKVMKKLKNFTLRNLTNSLLNLNAIKNQANYHNSLIAISNFMSEIENKNSISKLEYSSLCTRFSNYLIQALRGIDDNGILMRNIKISIDDINIIYLKTIGLSYGDEEISKSQKTIKENYKELQEKVKASK